MRYEEIPRPLEEKEIEILIEGLKNNDPGLNFMFMVLVSLRDEQLRAICEALKKNQTVKRIDFGKSPLSLVGAQYFGEVLKKNTTLTDLSLSKTGLTDEGIERICEGLIENQTLSTLDLSLNEFSSKGAFKIAEALEKNTTLDFLHLFGNRILKEGARRICAALRVNQTLTGIILFECSFIDSCGSEADLLMSRNKLITSEKDPFILMRKLQSLLKDKVFNHYFNAVKGAKIGGKSLPFSSGII